MLNWFGKRLRYMQEVKRDQRGFTLIELLVVVIIIGILAAIAIPTFLAQRDRAQEATAQSDLRNLTQQATVYASDNAGSYTGMTYAILDAAPYNFNPSDGVTGHAVTVTDGGNSYTATATAKNGTVFNFNSTTGRITP